MSFQWNKRPAVSICRRIAPRDDELVVINVLRSARPPAGLMAFWSNASRPPPTLLADEL